MFPHPVKQRHGTLKAICGVLLDSWNRNVVLELEPLNFKQLGHIFQNAISVSYVVPYNCNIVFKTDAVQ